MSETPEMLSSPPPYYPVMLDLRGKHCLVVGGGKVAQRKVEGLLKAGAIVTVVAPKIEPMPDEVKLEQRTFVSSDMDGVMLVIAATDNRAVNAEVAHEANVRGIFVNVVDDPAYCSMILPSVVRRGALLIAISTGGASPVLARRLRESLEKQFGEEFAPLVELLWRLRQVWEPKALAAQIPAENRRQAWEEVLDLPLLEMIGAGKVKAAEEAALQILNTYLGKWGLV